MRGLEERSSLGPHNNLKRPIPDRELDVASARARRGGRGGPRQGAIQLGHILARAADVVEDLGGELAQKRRRHIPAEELEREIERLTRHVCEIL